MHRPAAKILILCAMAVALLGVTRCHGPESRGSSRLVTVAAPGDTGIAAGATQRSSSRSHSARGVTGNARDGPGLVARLRDADPDTTRPLPVAVDAGVPLAPDRVAALLDRLPALEVEASDDSSFIVRAGTPPPPRTGEVVALPFPPDATVTPPTVDPEGPLHVLRYAPEGEVPVARNLSISFSEPMVAVGDLQSTEAFVPATLTPQPEGRWRWLGARSLVFEPKTRFPAATKYHVEVSAGTQATSGNRLEDGIAFSFATPPLRVVRSQPSGASVALDPVLFMEFDQRVDPEALRDFIALRETGTQRHHPIRLVSLDELPSDSTVRRDVERAHTGRWLALRPQQPLPPGTKFEYIVSEGAPSAEGERRTSETQRFEFSTYEALAVKSHRCGWDEACPPNRGWRIDFNNPLDPDQEIDVEIEPPIEQLRIEHHGNTISISGSMSAKTRYEVGLPATLRDAFGQSLGSRVTLDFETGAAERQLYGPMGDLITLDPYSASSVPVFSTNNKKLSVRVQRVVPADWRAYRSWSRSRIKQDAFEGGEAIFDDWIQLEDEDRLAEAQINLTPYLRNGLGHFVVWIETPDRLSSRKLMLEPKARSHVAPGEDHRRLVGDELLYWVQVTGLGVTSVADPDALVSWVTRLKDGSPVGGARVELDPPISPPAQTDANGLATQALERTTKEAPLLVARHGEDAAILPQPYARHRQDDRRQTRLLWYHADDRGLYRPGESVHLKGWVRRLEATQGSSLELPRPAVERVGWILNGPRGRKLAEGTAALSSLGGFDLVVEIPEDAELGYANLAFSVAEGSLASKHSESHGFMIQEFRRPEFEVTTRFGESEARVGDEIHPSVEASYYAGGPLPNAETTWRVHAESGHFAPPGRDDFHFGVWRPWWGEGFVPAGRKELGEFASRTDATGKHMLAISLEALAPPQPAVLFAQASVEDRNRQAWTSTAQILVHPSDLYIGLRSQNRFVRVGEPYRVGAIVVDHAGEVAEGVELTMSLGEGKDFVWTRAASDPNETPLAVCSTTSRDEPASCAFVFERSGRYRVTARIVDAAGRPNESELMVWVSGGEAPPLQRSQAGVVQLIPDRAEYRPGDTAEIFVQPPFFPAEALLTLAANGILTSEPFRIDEASHRLQIPITEAHVPGFSASVEIVGLEEADAPSNGGSSRRVAYGSGSLALKVPPTTQTLQVELSPADKKLAPGGKTDIALRVRGPAGKPVSNAEVAIFVVDESVLALTGYQLEDPLDTFYPPRYAGLWTGHQREQISLRAPSERSMSVRNLSAPAPEMAFKGSNELAMSVAGVGTSPAPIQLRKDFSALALFAASLATDSRGKATVALQLPDSVTRYRIMAVAASGPRDFGKGESQITARLPLTARPSPPRFANFGDRFELPVVVQNQTDEAMTVDVAIRSNLQVFASEAPDAAQMGRRLEVPANDRVEVRFSTAPKRVGRAHFQVAVASDALADAAEFDFPVRTPATSEAFATYGVIDEGAVAQPIAPPQDVWPQFGGLEVSTSSTQLQALSDAMLYLNTYPFECSEQIASRMLSVLALGDFLEAFAVEGLPEPERLRTRIQQDLTLLSSLQNRDGGFGFWQYGETSWPFLTIHVAHAALRARAAGYAAPTLDTRALSQYLREIDRHVPRETSERSANAMRAYALYVRRLAGELDVAETKRLAGEEALSVESLGWLLPVLKESQANVQLEQVERRLSNLASETAAGAQFTTNYSDGAHLILHSERRADGVVLGGLMEASPDSDLIPKLVRGLLAHRKQGRWSNTQENVFILLALAQYFERFEGTAPDFVARLWLGEGFAGQHEFAGRSTERVQLDVPMRALAASPSPTPLVIEKQGPGRLYYRVGLRYAPRDLASDALDNGFAIAREYEAIDDPADLSRDRDGTWRIRAGARVRISLSMASSMRRHHVALVDPLPAGLEVIDTALATSPRPPPQPLERGIWRGWGRWYDHENLRDDRIEAFSALLPAGAYSYRYTARATTPGEFVVPPARAEEMYQPETFGRTASTRVVVE